MGKDGIPQGDAAFRRTGLKGSGIEPTYAGVHSFMRRKYTRELSGVDIAVTGIPFEVEHGIDEMLQDPRTREVAVLRDVADQKDGATTHAREVGQ